MIKKHKYNAKKTIINGITFASKKEAERYKILKKMESNGEISELELQPRFLLQEKFKYRGKTIREINYIADFKYLKNDKVIVEDTKGFVTDVFKIKIKIFKFKYPNIEIIIL